MMLSLPDSRIEVKEQQEAAAKFKNSTESREIPIAGLFYREWVK
jgi:hypothetical protein